MRKKREKRTRSGAGHVKSVETGQGYLLPWVTKHVCLRCRMYSVYLSWRVLEVTWDQPEGFSAEVCGAEPQPDEDLRACASFSKRPFQERKAKTSSKATHTNFILILQSTYVQKVDQLTILK